jgi:tetratricopeptide (TPR) repeat protein
MVEFWNESKLGYEDYGVKSDTTINNKTQKSNYTMKSFFFLCLLMMMAGAVEAQGTFSGKIALEWINSGELNKAGDYIKTHSSSQRNNPDWHYAKGHLEYAQSDFRKAMNSFDKAISLNPESMDYLLWYGNAICSATEVAGVLSQYQLARRCKASYERVLEKYPDNVDARVHLISFHLQAPALVGGSKSTARKLADEIMERDTFRGYQSYFRIASNAGDHANVVSVLEQAILVYPDTTHFRYNLGLHYIQSGSFEKAYTEIKVCTQQHPENWRYLYQIGRLAALGDIRHQEGIRAFKVILSDVPDDMNSSFHSSAFARLAQIYLHLSDVELAKEAISEALTIQPENELANQIKRELRN